MKLKYLVMLGVTLSLTVGCARESVLPQPSADATNPSPNLVNTVNSSSNSSKSPVQAVVKSGTFVAGEHPSEGTVRIVTENSKSYLELDRAFKTSDMGPDLHVILHRSDDVLGSTKPPSYPLQEQDYVILGRLQKFNGAQRYPISDNINLADYKSATIWCRKFNATFGTAKLSS
jgi:hypothetical protein